MVSSLHTMNGMRKLIWAKNTQFCLFNFNLGHFPNAVSPEATKMWLCQQGWSGRGAASVFHGVAELP